MKLKEIAPFARWEWEQYLEQLERCERIAAFEGTPTEPIPSHLINSGEWERNGQSGIMFHIAYRQESEQLPAPTPESLLPRMVFLAVISTITGAWLALLWKVFA